MSANNPNMLAMVMQQLGIDPTQQNNTGALSNPGMGMGVLSMTGNRRGSPAFNSVPTVMKCSFELVVQWLEPPLKVRRQL